MLPKLALGFLIILVLASCGSPAVKHGPQALPPLPDEPVLSASDEQHHVYSVILNDLASNHRSHFVVVDSTLARPNFDGLGAFMTTPDPRPKPAEYDSLYKKLWSKPRLFRIEVAGLRTTASVRMVHVRDSVAFRDGEFGIHAFSPVAFNADSTRAVVYYQVKCGVVCGWGKVVLLARRPGRIWIIWHSRQIWVS